jgi:hypothetical protein
MNKPATIQNLKLKELLELLIRHFDIHEGVYDISVDFQVGVGAIGPSPDQLLPGAMIGVSAIGIAAADKAGPNTADAAVCNPRVKPRSRSRKQKGETVAP